MSSRVIGLDLGSSSVKAAQVLRKGDGTFVVEHQAARRLPYGAVYDGHVNTDFRDRVSRMIAEMFVEEKFSTKDVIFGLNSSNATFMDEVLVPVVPEKDVASSMPLLLNAQNGAYDDSKAEMSYSIVGVVETPDGPRLKVLVFRALVDPVREMSEVIEAAGLKVVGADLNALASLRVVSTQDRPDMVVDAIVDMGASVTTILIHHNGVPRMLSLDPQFAGGVATERVADALGIDPENVKAEWSKINDESELGLVPQARTTYAREASSRIQRVISDYVTRTDDVTSVASLTLVGGGALLAGLGESMRRSFPDIPRAYAQFAGHVTASNPEGILRQERESGGDYLVAVGLGTGAVL